MTTRKVSKKDLDDAIERAKMTDAKWQSRTVGHTKDVDDAIERAMATDSTRQSRRTPKSRGALVGQISVKRPASSRHPS